MNAVMERAPVRSVATKADQLRFTTTAVRVSLRWLGVRKTLSPGQMNEAAESFGAEGDYLSARKKLLDTRHPAFKEVTAIRGRILAYWKGCTLPYPEPGVRLIKQAKIEAFNQMLEEFREELHEAVRQLDRQYDALKAAARTRLGRLYNADDYPASLEGWFGVEWDFPAVEPPDFLMQLHPEIYEQERARVAQRFQQAIELAEQAFLGEFARLVAHLTERLTDSGDGNRKVFRDSAMGNLVEFFERFKQLNVRSNPELDQLVERAQRVVQGQDAQSLRDNVGLRRSIAEQLSQVQAAMDGMLVEQPRRRIIRPQIAAQGEGHGPAD